MEESATYGFFRLKLAFSQGTCILIRTTMSSFIIHPVKRRFHSVNQLSVFQVLGICLIQRNHKTAILPKELNI